MSQSEHSTAPLRPMPVKRLAAAAVLMVAACIGGYMLTPKWQALRLRGDNAQLFAALATVLYYQAGQHMTPATREMINKALALDATEVTAQMLLAADAFMQADYAQAVSLWQTLLDANSPRVNRAQLVEAINLAKLLQNRQK
ncbi:hypothetical protein IAR93_001941 [Salmonella enterica subsp. enterica serovar Montevideo]|nr:hypothetical protein [Salmonella enterica subsp. enterica serovar Montevideo]